MAQWFFCLAARWVKIETLNIYAKEQFAPGFNSSSSVIVKTSWRVDTLHIENLCFCFNIFTCSYRVWQPGCFHLVNHFCVCVVANVLGSPAVVETTSSWQVFVCLCTDMKLCRCVFGWELKMKFEDGVASTSMRGSGGREGPTWSIHSHPKTSGKIWGFQWMKISTEICRWGLKG